MEIKIDWTKVYSFKGAYNTTQFLDEVYYTKKEVSNVLVNKIENLDGVEFVKIYNNTDADKVFYIGCIENVDTFRKIRININNIQNSLSL